MAKCPGHTLLLHCKVILKASTPTVYIGIIRPWADLHAVRGLNEDYRKFDLVQRLCHSLISFYLAQFSIIKPAIWIPGHFASSLLHVRVLIHVQLVSIESFNLIAIQFRYLIVKLRTSTGHV